MNPISDPMPKQIDDVFDEDDCVFTLTRKKSLKPLEASVATWPADREDLDTKFIKLVQEARLRSEAELSRRRAESVLEARAYVPPIEVPAHAEPPAFSGGKVVFAKGVDPKRDPTLVGRHMDEAMRVFGGTYLRSAAPALPPKERALLRPALRGRLWGFSLLVLSLFAVVGIAYLQSYEATTAKAHKGLASLFLGAL